jgi:hypothetical protein
MKPWTALLVCLVIGLLFWAGIIWFVNWVVNAR